MSRRRHPYRDLAALILATYFAVTALYVVATAWAVSTGRLPATGRWQGAFQDALLPRINEVVVFTFFAACGASVGSFLNVVVWRLPQGLGVGGHSFCPRCRNTLRVRDNVPVFGWLWLGGRCRDCRLPISPRYPIVEACLAVTFALVGTVELYGWNLPFQSTPFRWSMDSPRVSGTQLLTAIYHLVGLSVAWAMGLIRYDGNRIPSPLVIFAAVWLMGGQLLCPSLGIVPWQMTVPTDWPPADWLQSGQWTFDSAMVTNALMRLLTALAAAAFFARVLARACCPHADLKLDPMGEQTGRLIDLTLLIAVVSLMVGWQATSGVLVAASGLAWLWGRIIEQDVAVADRHNALARLAVCLPVVLTCQIVLWRSLSQSGWWPGEHSSPGLIMAYGLGTLLIPLWLRDPLKWDHAPPPHDPSPGIEQRIDRE
ncbi:A24 family peptidase [Allorhodopirellula solitaria]|uniref:A24 family peptidase n=1 Tax=Allorhodopirellula solitaria TaxID=2527987 RepID=UPI0028F40CA8|nr:prepilin peptidase [Allorhodopirellula solitaria]